MSTFEVFFLVGLSIAGAIGVGTWVSSIGAGVAAWVVLILWIRSMP